MCGRGGVAGTCGCGDGCDGRRRRPTAERSGTKTTKITKTTHIYEEEMSKEFADIPAETEWIGRRVIGCAIAVHRELGPGYKEPIHVDALCLEMDLRGLAFEREKPILV